MQWFGKKSEQRIEKAPGGSMGWSLWNTTAPVSGNSAATIITLIRGKRSGTGKSLSYYFSKVLLLLRSPS